jgi:SAM-dependent methyltransferase
MHPNNHLLWSLYERRYKPWFHGANTVLEVGSYDVNGSVRQHFSGFEKYVGVDRRAGPGVDVVSRAAEMKFRWGFDVVVSSSMLEHDPAWRASLDRMFELVLPRGILLLSWGTTGCPPHSFESAEDGGFHPIAARTMLAFLARRSFFVHDFRYEGDLPGAGEGQDEWGFAALAAFHDPAVAPGPPTIARFLEDRRP